MSDEYCRYMLRVAVAQICQQLGWHAVQSSPLEMLTDILERYIVELGKSTHRYSEQFGRTDPNLQDLGLVFAHQGIPLGELEEYLKYFSENVSYPKESVAFPVSKPDNLAFPKLGSRELRHRPEHVEDHLPVMHRDWADDDDVSPIGSPKLETPMASSELDISKALSEKRPNPSPELPTPKRARINFNLPDEAGHSLYEMTSVAMTSYGVLTPTRHAGKLPDARTPPQTIRQLKPSSRDARPPSKKVGPGGEGSSSTAGLDALLSGIEHLESLQFGDKGDVPGDKNRDERDKSRSKEKSRGKDGSRSKESSRSKDRDKDRSKDKTRRDKDKDEKEKENKSKDREKSKSDKRSDGKDRKYESREKSRSSNKDKDRHSRDKKTTSKSAPRSSSPRGKSAGSSKEKRPSSPRLSTPLVIPKPVRIMTSPHGKSPRGRSPHASSPNRKDVDCQEPMDLTVKKKSHGDSSSLPLTALADMFKTSIQTDRHLSPKHSALSPKKNIPSPVRRMERVGEESPEIGLVIDFDGDKKKQEKDAADARLASIAGTIDDVLNMEISGMAFSDDSDDDDDDEVAKLVAEKSETSDAASPQKAVVSPQKQNEPLVSKTKEMLVPLIKPLDFPTLKSRESNRVSIEDSIASVLQTLSSQDDEDEPMEEGNKPRSKKKGSKGSKEKSKEKLGDMMQDEGIPSMFDTLPKIPTFPRLPEQKLSVYDFSETPKVSPVPSPGTSGPLPRVDMSPTQHSAHQPAQPPWKAEPMFTDSSEDEKKESAKDPPPIQRLKIGIGTDVPTIIKVGKDKSHKKNKKKDKEKKKKTKDKEEKRRRKLEKKAGKNPMPFVPKITLKIGGGGDGSPSQSTVTVINRQPEVSKKKKKEEKLDIPRLVIKGLQPPAQEVSPPKAKSPTPEPERGPIKEPTPQPPTPPPPKIFTPPRQRVPTPVRSPTPPSPSPSPPPPSPPPTRYRSPTPSPVHSPPPRIRSPSPAMSRSPFSSPSRSNSRSRSRSPSPPYRRSPSQSPSPVSRQHSPSPERRSPSPPRLTKQGARGGKKTPAKPPTMLSSRSKPLDVFSRYSPSPPRRRRSSPSLSDDSSRDSSINRASSSLSRARSRSSSSSHSPPTRKSPSPSPSPKRSPSYSPPRRSPSSSPERYLSPSPVQSSSSSDSEDSSPPTPPPGKKKAPVKKKPPSPKKAAPPPPPPSKPLTKAQLKGQPSPRVPKGKAGKGQQNQADIPPMPPSKYGQKAAGGSAKKGKAAAAKPAATAVKAAGGSKKMTLTTETVGTIVDEKGQKIWICPACAMPDDGSPMIGCDDCDDWYHWPCVDITEEPDDDVDWYCPRCLQKRKPKKKGRGGGAAGRGRKRGK